MLLHPIQYDEGIIWVDNQKSVNKGLRWWVSGEDGLGRIVDTLSYLYYGNPVLAQSPNLSIPNIPYIEIEDDVDLLTAKSLLQKNYDLNDEFNVSAAGGYCSGFKDGYKAASAKKYTEEDLRKAIGHSVYTINPSLLGSSDFTKEEDRIIQSLQPKPVSVEIDMYNGNTDEFCQYWKDGKPFIKVIKVNYETDSSSK